jgi:hypothetical protein
MNLSVRNNVLVYRQFGQDVKLPIANMTKKVYDYNSKQVFINTIINSKTRQFVFKLSEIEIPKFTNFDAMVLWFDVNVVLVPTSAGGKIFDEEIDGGSAASIYLASQLIDGGNA